jgi:hypothetical protein
MLKNNLLIFILFLSCATGSSQSFTASTPAGAEVRRFLGIPLRDSVDFIRWDLELTNYAFNLKCNYGVGLNNTNGFIDGGFNVSFIGSFSLRENRVILKHNKQTLMFYRINPQLLHLLDDDNNLLVGNAGWSYVLNLVSAKEPIESVTSLPSFLIKDSAIFEGRTPCGIPGLNQISQHCYKIKWRINFYSSNLNGNEGEYIVQGTIWRSFGSKNGVWKYDTSKQGLILFDNKRKPVLYLIHASDKVLYFSTEKFYPLVGDKDFSYVLNRR